MASKSNSGWMTILLVEITLVGSGLFLMRLADRFFGQERRSMANFGAILVGSHGICLLDLPSSRQVNTRMTSDGKHPTTAFWILVAVLPALIRFPPAEVKSDEAEKTPTPAADSMLGKEAGQTRDDNGLKLKMVWCPPGKFSMGSPQSEKDREDDEDQGSVTLTNGFWVGKFEVTQGEWESVMGTVLRHGLRRNRGR